MKDDYPTPDGQPFFQPTERDTFGQPPVDERAVIFARFHHTISGEALELHGVDAALAFINAGFMGVQEAGADPLKQTTIVLTRHEDGSLSVDMEAAL